MTALGKLPASAGRGSHGIFAVVICTICKMVRSYDLRGLGPRLISRGGGQ